MGVGRLAALAALVCVAGCASAQPVREVAHLRVIAEPPEARVELEEVFYAPARALRTSPARLEPGLHLVTIRAAGFFPHDLELDLPPGETVVEISLRPIPD